MQSYVKTRQAHSAWCIFSSTYFCRIGNINAFGFSIRVWNLGNNAQTLNSSLIRIQLLMMFMCVLVVEYQSKIGEPSMITLRPRVMLNTVVNSVAKYLPVREECIGWTKKNLRLLQWVVGLANKWRRHFVKVIHFFGPPCIYMCKNIMLLSITARIHRSVIKYASHRAV